MGILTGGDEGIKLMPLADLAFIGTLTDYAKGISTRSLPSTVHYTLEFEKYEQIRGSPIENEEPHFHYMQIGSASFTVDPKTQKFIPGPEPKRPQTGQLYLALLYEPQQIQQLVEITTDDIDSLRKAGAEK